MILSVSIIFICGNSLCCDSPRVISIPARRDEETKCFSPRIDADERGLKKAIGHLLPVFLCPMQIAFVFLSAFIGVHPRFKLFGVVDGHYAP